MKSYVTATIVAIISFLSACSRTEDSMEEVDRIKADAIAAHPSDPVAATKAANETLERRALGAESSNPQEVASLIFLGYYAKNVYAIPSVCKTQRVDLAAYSTAFVEANRAPFQAAATTVDSKTAIERARLSAERNARVELAQFAAAQQTDLKGACSFIKEHAVEMANGAKFANIMPRIYEHLVRP